MMTRRIIEFEGICKSYGDKEILKNLNLCIDKGEFLTIIGSSGCGKTTLLKLVNGLIIPDKGRVLVYGEDISKISKTELRRRIGYVIQEVGLFPHMNVRKNISYVLDLINKDNKRSIQERTEYLIKSVGLSKEILNRYPGELSGGQRQRIGIARALAAKPNIILMDEPFGAVDEIMRKLLQEEILRIYNELNVTIIFITHDIREALKLGTRVIVMDEGNIIQSGTPTEIRENPKTIFVKDLIGA
ncbi:ABC transporter ATP-binding protein [Clostridium botulinum]|uniref:ABC-type quaternary amine transporter n=2 Tax=Clostridium botulinum TaxID=1491 RepID=A0A6B4RSN9_CLOBO|nr:ABC transporter ATP-binding protein [Clostridium botulinum]KAI3347187.1 ABC transporter ATP-binding protein [Clostridium botulinum]MBN1041687.1 ABC transporter ATP-binding protein [Clostridium botulinum]MBN1048344.1 ABC transporter ATP-binding protein [Clostridium botulinum]MBN1077341.1 ABC transporter ATP-binding protein [Clostridium botulinum]MBY6789518.1 ABC transporter ATP-binding protein [Clostridium botulinum]